jgi:multisubunit Na+/H+ antiporter MnhB subunit
MSDSIILRTIVKAAFPLLLSFAALLFLAGHNAPGGGFIAGLLAAAAIVLRYMSRGRQRDTESADGLTGLIAGGLLLAAATAFTPTLLGYDFFTHTFGFIQIPLLGEVEWATAAIFDLGVLLVVVGNVVTVLRAMTDEEEGGR